LGYSRRYGHHRRVKITERFSEVSPPSIGETYLILAKVSPEGIARVAGGWEGIFAVSGDRLVALYK
jgi:hypothetical protein